jgi:DNA polymerase sigma
MIDKLHQITKELKTFFDSQFFKEYFTIIYGSYSYGIDTSNSDLDFVVVSKEFNQRNLRNTLDFTFDL